MPWQPALGTQPLAPFDHQVAGQSSMLKYDKTTVCKPLIGREHFVYKTLPQELKEFTPEYRGEIEVQLLEQDGYIQLYGLSVGNETSDDLCPCSSVSENHEPLDVRPKVISKDASIKNRSTARVLRSGSYEVSPLTDEVFYTADSNPENPHTQSLNPWSLKNHKRLLDKMRKSEHSHNKIRFILLKNVVADFRHPCILDLKIGSRLHGDDASSVKVASQSEKCKQTTSSTLGVRLCGMQVYQVDSGAYHSVDKYHGRTLNDESFGDMLYDFLHNGSRFRSELIQPVVSRLSELIECLENQHSFRFYASSLLIIYDGEAGSEVPEGDVSFTAENQEITRDVDLNSEAHETKGDLGSSDGNTIIKGHVNVFVDDQEAKTQALHPNETADLTPVPAECHHFSIKGHHSARNLPNEHSHSSKTLYEHVNSQPKDHLYSSKGLFQTVDKDPVQDSVMKPPDAVSDDICPVSYSASFQSLIFNHSKQSPLKPVSASGKMTNEIQTTSLTNKNVKIGSFSDSSTINCHVDAVKNPITEIHHQKSDPAKNNVLDNEKHFMSSAQSINTDGVSHWLKNHINRQESDHTDLSSLAIGKEDICPDYDPEHDAHNPESQAALLDMQKNEQETGNATVTQPSRLSSVNSTQTDPLLVTVKHSVMLNRTQEQLSDTSYSSTTNDSLCHVQIPEDVSLSDLKCQERTSVTQGSLCFGHPSMTVSSPGVAGSQDVTPPTTQTSSYTALMTNLLTNSSDSYRNSVKVDVKMIDFAHTTHSGFTSDKVQHVGPDTDYILGLKNLMKLFQELQKRK